MLVKIKIMENNMRKIKGYDNYVITNYGEVINIKRNRKIKASIRKDGYNQITLYSKGKSKRHYIHRLVAKNFIINTDYEKKQINHINGNKSDNNVNNLEWVTPKENTIHAINNGLKIFKRDSYIQAGIKNRKTTQKQDEEIRQLSKEGMSFRKIGLKFKITHKTVSGIVKQIGCHRNRPDNRILKNKVLLDRSVEKTVNVYSNSKSKGK